MEVFTYCMPMITLDGTHTGCMILLLAATLDVKKFVIVLLGYSWVPSGNEANWLMFLTLLKKATNST